MSELRQINSSWKINDGFDHLRSKNFVYWISKFNEYSTKAGAEKLVLSDKSIAKAISFWYISIKLLKRWNELDQKNNHWSVAGDNLRYFDDTLTIKELYESLNKSEGYEAYKIETIRRYVGEMCSVGLLRRAGNIASGRLQPSTYLACAVASTQKEWMGTYETLSKAMAKTLLNSSEKWDVFEYDGVRNPYSGNLAGDRAKAQFI